MNESRNLRGVAAAATLVLLAACGKTENGDVVIQRPKGVVTTPDTLHMPSVGTTPETVTTPTVTTKPETLIVTKPVIGSKKTVIQRPTVKP